MSDVEDAIARAYRAEWAVIVAGLAGRFGDLDLAEESAAEAFAKYLFSDAGQELAAKYHYRVSSKKVAAKNKDKFARTEVVDVNALYGSWAEINKKFFGEDGWFDQIYVKQ